MNVLDDAVDPQRAGGVVDEVRKRWTVGRIRRGSERAARDRVAEVIERSHGGRPEGP